MAHENPDPDFADLPPIIQIEIEGSLGQGLHHAPPVGDELLAGEAFHHPEQDAAGTTWEPNWEPIETYRDGEIVMLDDGNEQLLGRREMGLWTKLTDGEKIAQPDYRPMLWSYAPDSVKDDMMAVA